MKIKQIISFLEENNIAFKDYNINSQLDFKPASLKAIINQGLYYVVGDFDLSTITNSLIITDQFRETSNVVIVVENPQLTFYKLLQLEVEPILPQIHHTAIIHPNAKIGKNVSIGAYVVIEDCVIEDNVVLKPNVVVYKNTTIKSGCFIDSNSCIGPSGLAWIWDDNGNRIIQPQLGGVIIEKNCHIGTDVSITKGSLSENTIIGENTLIAHGTKIGHGCKVSKHVHMANNVSLAGNAVIGERVFLGSASIVSSNISVPNNSIVGAGTLVNKKFEEEYVTLVGVPAKILKANNYNHKPNGAPKPFKTK